MARVLLVDDAPEWQDLLRRALPTYQVAVADSYEKALECLEEVPYEVAVVDLNLLDSTHRDELGAELLTLLRNDHPTTRRIGLTGVPPAAVMRLGIEYGLDELLLKAEVKLAEIRSIVSASVEKAYADVPRDVRAARADLWDKAILWKRHRLRHLDRIEEIRHQDLREAESAGRSGEGAQSALTELQAMKRKLLSKAKAFFNALSKARSDDDVKRMSAEFSRLTGDFGVSEQ
jgi:response regulator RpfG family c-di-GMP phosphodiesterase